MVHEFAQRYCLKPSATHRGLIGGYTSSIALKVAWMVYKALVRPLLCLGDQYDVYQILDTVSYHRVQRSRRRRDRPALRQWCPPAVQASGNRKAAVPGPASA